MPGPFINNIKGTTSGTPGTGAFTPNAASSGFLAWSTVPTGWIGLVRYEDGTSWELQYSYWNGTTLSRSSTQFVSSSSGSALTLTSAATATLVEDGSKIAPTLLSMPKGVLPTVSGTGYSSSGVPSPTTVGTAAGFSVVNTNYLSEQWRVRMSSATTANAQAGTNGIATTVATTSSTAGRGGWEYTIRFGCSTIPTGPRIFAGMTDTTYLAVTTEPSALTGNYAVLGLDSTDTNLQFLVNSGVGSGTKIDTGIPLVANGWYEYTMWSDPGSLTVKALLIRRDTGAIFYSSTSTDTPVTGTAFAVQNLFGLSSTTGTAMVLEFGGYTIRTGI